MLHELMCAYHTSAILLPHLCEVGQPPHVVQVEVGDDDAADDVAVPPSSTQQLKLREPGWKVGGGRWELGCMKIGCMECAHAHHAVLVREGCVGLLCITGRFAAHVCAAMLPMWE